MAPNSILSLPPVRTQKEVAHELGITTNQVKSIERRAFQKIRRHLVRALGPEYFTEYKKGGAQ